jgi:hyperosmotically inducible protein
MAYATRIKLLLPAIALMCAQQPAKTWSQDEGLRIMTEAQKNLARLDHYAVFDWLTLGVRGKTIVLNGYASRPLLKDEADRSLKGIAGVDSLDNQIEILPLSPNDDRIRASAYNRIYTHPALSRYNANQG